MQVDPSRLYFVASCEERRRRSEKGLRLGKPVSPAHLRAPLCNATLGGMEQNLHVRHYLVKGRVQGVGFRWFVHGRAAEIGLRGWVKNTDEGHVELVAAGDAEQIAELREALERGSRGSRVDAIVEHELQEQEAEKLGPFEIEGAW